MLQCSLGQSQLDVGIWGGANCEAENGGRNVSPWKDYLAGMCILSLCLGFDAELANFTVLNVPGCPDVKTVTICQQPDREAVIPLHIDSTSGTPFMARI